MNRSEPQEDFEEARPSIWTRVKERVFGPDEFVEDEPAGASSAASRNSIRMDTARGLQVTIRLNAAVFNDARTAADGLKNGQQQIVNLERAEQHMAERIIDFLNGVVYALDGTVEKIGERVYLYAPANVRVEIDSGTEIR